MSQLYHLSNYKHETQVSKNGSLVRPICGLKLAPKHPLPHPRKELWHLCQFKHTHIHTLHFSQLVAPVEALGIPQGPLLHVTCVLLELWKGFDLSRWKHHQQATRWGRCLPSVNPTLLQLQLAQNDLSRDCGVCLWALFFHVSAILMLKNES